MLCCTQTLRDELNRHVGVNSVLLVSHSVSLALPCAPEGLLVSDGQLGGEVVTVTELC